MLIPSSSEPQGCPRGHLGLSQRFGAFFLLPRNGKGQTKVQPCPTATHGTPPHKANLELFWRKIQEIFDCQEEKHQNRPQVGRKAQQDYQSWERHHGHHSMESQSPEGWKRLPRSSPTINSHSLLNNVLECHIHTFLEHFQGW